MGYIDGMLYANMANKIIFKNTTSASNFKKINLSILTKLKKHKNT